MLCITKVSQLRDVVIKGVPEVLLCGLLYNNQLHDIDVPDNIHIIYMPNVSCSTNTYDSCCSVVIPQEMPVQ